MSKNYKLVAVISVAVLFAVFFIVNRAGSAQVTNFPLAAADFDSNCAGVCEGINVTEANGKKATKIVRELATAETIEVNINNPDNGSYDHSICLLAKTISGTANIVLDDLEGNNITYTINDSDYQLKCNPWFYHTSGSAQWAKVTSLDSTIRISSVVVLQRPGNTPPFKFNAVGDINDMFPTNAVLTSIASDNADFTLALGDLAYDNDEIEWCNYVKSYVGPNYPFELIVGNHDDNDATGSARSDIFVTRTCLPDQIGNIVEGNEEGYGIEYYFDYNNLARFVQIAPAISNGRGYDYDLGDPHYQWVESVLDDANNQGMQWVVLSMHENCLTPGIKSCSIGEDLLNLAIDKGVDLVLQGHEHAYFRSKQIDHGPSCTTVEEDTYNPACVTNTGGVFKNDEGLVIAIVGTGGTGLYSGDYTLDSEYNYFESFNNADDNGGTHGPLSFEVTPNEITANFLNSTAGSTFSDSFVIEK